MELEPIDPTRPIERSTLDQSSSIAIINPSRASAVLLSLVRNNLPLALARALPRSLSLSPCLSLDSSLARARSLSLSQTTHITHVRLELAGAMRAVFEELMS